MADRRHQLDPDFGQLHIHVYGFFRARIYDDADAQDLAQNTWEIVLKNRSRYDPLKGPPESFVMYWANIVLLRHYDARRQYQEAQKVLGQIRQRFPSIMEGEESTGLTTTAPVPPEKVIIRMEETQRRVEAYDKLVQITLNSSSPPHQLLAFGFRELLGQNPREIVERYSDTILRELTVQFETAYLHASQLPADKVRPHFQTLRRQMDRKVGEVITDTRTRQIYKEQLGRIVGDTTLRDYYTNPDSPADNIYQWRWAVLRRVVQDVFHQPDLLVLLTQTGLAN